MKMVATLVLFLLLLNGISASANNDIQDNRLAEILVNEGFENVSVTLLASDELEVLFENRVYRDDVKAISVVLEKIYGEIKSEDKQVFLSLLKAGNPICRFKVNLSEWISTKQSGHPSGNTLIRFQLPSSNIVQRPRQRLNTTGQKFDILLSPVLDLNLGNREDPFKFKSSFDVGLGSNILNGLSLAMSYRIPLVDEINVIKDESARPYTFILNYLQPCRRNIFFNINLGYFSGERYGVSLQAAKFINHGNFSITGRLDYTGFLLLKDKHWFYSNPNLLTYSVGLKYHFTKYNLFTELLYERYIKKDRGLNFSFGRFINETRLSFFGIYDTAEKWVGFEFRFPLFPQKRLKPGRVRLNIPNTYTINYSGIATDYGRNFKIENDLLRLMERLNQNYISTNCMKKLHP